MSSCRRPQSRVIVRLEALSRARRFCRWKAECTVDATDGNRQDIYRNVSDVSSSGVRLALFDGLPVDALA